MSIHSLFAMVMIGACYAFPLSLSAEPLTLEKAIERSLASHPSLIAANADLGVTQAQAQREGLAPQYTFTTEIENVMGTGEVRGLKSTETTFRIGRVIELGGKQEARQRLSAAQMALQRNTLSAEQIDIASNTEARFIAVLAEQAQVEMAKKRLQLAQQTRNEVANWVKAARNPETDLHAADIAVADATIALAKAERQLTVARMALANSWGASEVDFDQVSGSLERLPDIPPFKVLAARLENTPLFRNTVLEADALRARRRVAISNTKPDVDANLGVRRLSASNDQALVMSVSIPLGSRRRGRYAIAEVDAELAAQSARQEALRANMLQTLFSTYEELMQNRQEYEALAKTMIPKAEQAYRFSMRGFKLGRFSFVALAQAQNTLFDLQQRKVEAAANYHILLADIERLTALTLEGESR